MNFKKYVDKIVEVKWKDIVTEVREDLSEVMDKEVFDLCELSTSYGVLVKEDKYGIVLVSDRCGEDVDYTAIPKGCILDISELNYKKEVKK